MKLLLLRCMSPELAHSRRTGCRWKGPLLGVNRTKSRVLESTRLTQLGHPGRRLIPGLRANMSDHTLWSPTKLMYVRRPFGLGAMPYLSP